MTRRNIIIGGIGVCLFLALFWMIFGRDSADADGEAWAESVKPAVQAVNVDKKSESSEPRLHYVPMSFNSSDVDLANFKALPESEQTTYVILNLSPLIDTEEDAIVKLLKRLQEGVAFDKLSTDLIRKRASLHADNLVDWISQIFPPEKVGYQVEVSALTIAKNKSDELRWEKLGKVLLQLQDRPDRAYESVQGTILSAMVREDSDRAISWVGMHDAETAGGLVNNLMSVLVELDLEKAKAFSNSLTDENLKQIAHTVLDVHLRGQKP